MKKIDQREEKIWCLKLCLLLMLILGFSYMNAIDIKPKHAGFWGDTWECKNCGYESYEGIDYCPVCSTQKGRSR